MQQEWGFCEWVAVGLYAIVCAAALLYSYATYVIARGSTDLDRRLDDEED